MKDDRLYPSGDINVILSFNEGRVEERGLENSCPEQDMRVSWYITKRYAKDTQVHMSSSIGSYCACEHGIAGAIEDAVREIERIRGI